MENEKANLFIVGAMKAGTTSFVELLSGHPQIYISPLKEPHYFVNDLPHNLYEPSRFFSLDNYFSKEFPEPLHIAKVKTIQQYEQLFSLARHQKYRGEGSTAYLHAVESAAMIHEYNPDAKIIILVRDPLQRAFSHYKMDLAKGRDTRPFETVLLEEIELYRKARLHWNGYLGMSLYTKAIKRYKDLFENVLIIKFENFINDPSRVFQPLEQFLEIVPFVENRVTHKNKSKTLRFQKLFYFLKRIGLKDYFSKIFSSRFRQWLFGKVSKKDTLKLKLSTKTMSQLEAIFEKESLL